MSGSPQVTPQEVAGLLFKPRLADTKAHDLSDSLKAEGCTSHHPGSCVSGSWTGPEGRTLVTKYILLSENGSRRQRGEEEGKARFRGP